MPAVRYFTGLRAMVRVTQDDRETVQHLKRNDELPANLAPGELENLETLGYVSDTPWAPPSAETDEAAAQARLALVREQTAETPLAARSDEQLIAWIREGDDGKAPNVDQVVEAVGDNPELASRMLAAEEAATSGDPRSSLKQKLEKVAEGGQ